MTPPPALLNDLARQLDVEPDALLLTPGATRPGGPTSPNSTTRLNLRAFDRLAFDAMAIWALPLATTVRDPETLAALIIEELRRRRILLPPIAVLELVVTAGLPSRHNGDAARLHYSVVRADPYGA